MSLLVSARWLAATANLYPSLCTIEAPTSSNDHGDVIAAPWAAVVGLTALACRVSPSSSGSERRTTDMTYSTTTHTITIAGRYTTILPHMRASIGGLYYDIEAITYDGEGIMTRLAARILV
jgi:hypothetical protein